MSDDPADWLAALQKARASGVLNIRHGDTTTTFRSLAEIDSIIASLQSGGSSTPGLAVRGPRLLYPRQLTKGL